jgi:hypothetical protein
MQFMGQMDLEKERQRLADVYARMEDTELQKIAADPDSLTDPARTALQTELSRRDLPNLPPTIESAAGNKEEKEPPVPVMIRRYRDLPDAALAKSILDSAGIESFLADDNTVRMDWLWSNAISGVKLWVRPEDAEAAVELLDQDTPDKFDLGGSGEYVQPRCPTCNSTDVVLAGLDRPAIYTGIFTALPPAGANRDWSCRSCGNEWVEGERPTQGVPGKDNQA